MPEVEPRFKDTQTRPWVCKARNAFCTRTKPCASCLGRRNRRKGREKQLKAQKQLGVEVGRYGTGQEERWTDPLFDNEIKSGKQVGPAWTWWKRAEGQIIAAQPEFGGQHKTPRVVLMPEGVNDGIVMVRLSAWNQIVAPALREMYG